MSQTEKPSAEEIKANTRGVIDQIRNEICWMLEREETTTFDAAIQAGLPRARVDRFLRSETDDFTVEELAILFASHDWAISLGSLARKDLLQESDWYERDEMPLVPRPVEDPAPGLNSEPID